MVSRLLSPLRYLVRRTPATCTHTLTRLETASRLARGSRSRSRIHHNDCGRRRWNRCHVLCSKLRGALAHERRRRYPQLDTAFAAALERGACTNRWPCGVRDERRDRCCASRATHTPVAHIVQSNTLRSQGSDHDEVGWRDVARVTKEAHTAHAARRNLKTRPPAVAKRRRSENVKASEGWGAGPRPDVLAASWS